MYIVYCYIKLYHILYDIKLSYIIHYILLYYIPCGSSQRKWIRGGTTWAPNHESPLSFDSSGGSWSDCPLGFSVFPFQSKKIAWKYKENGGNIHFFMEVSKSMCCRNELGVITDQVGDYAGCWFWSLRQQPYTLGFPRVYIIDMFSFIQATHAYPPTSLDIHMQRIDIFLIFPHRPIQLSPGFKAVSNLWFGPCGVLFSSTRLVFVKRVSRREHPACPKQ